MKIMRSGFRSRWFSVRLALGLMLGVTSLTIPIPISSVSASVAVPNILRRLTPLASSEILRGPMAAAGSAFNSPSPRYAAAMAYDAARGKTVLFGGSDGSQTYSRETWIWDGRTWSQLTPVTSPPAQYGASMAYDPIRQNVVLFGGDGSTWTWDGTNWTQRRPATSPAGRLFPGLVWDGATANMLLFGGDGIPSGHYNDTWTWDGTNWTQQLPANSPTFRSPNIAYDAAHSKVVVFGGFGCCTAFGGDEYFNDTWIWDGSNWTHLNPSLSPYPRGYAAMGFHTVIGQVVLFGGETPGVLYPGRTNDTWTWDGTNWTRVDGTPSPSAREMPSSAYDSARGAFVLFGGNDPTPALGDTWIWTGSWTGLLGSGPSIAEAQSGGSPNQYNVHCEQGRYPVDCTTGEFWHTFVDLNIPGRGIPLLFSRTYSSFNIAQDSVVGFGWTHSYNISLSFDAAGNVTLHQANGTTLPFAAVTSGFQAPPRVMGQLVRNPDSTFAFTQKDKTRFTFSSTGQLTSEADRNGNTTTLSYSAGQLASVTDSAGRSLTFGYTGSRLTRVSDGANRQVSFLYDASGNLTSATDVAGSVSRFTYDTWHDLVTMTDPNNGVVSNAFQYGGYVTVSQTDPMNRQTTYTYASGSTTSTDPNGNVTVQHT